MRLKTALGPTVAEIVDDKYLKEIRPKIGLRPQLINGHRDGVRVIPEIKPSSPSHGNLRSIDRKELSDVAQQMASGGAAAISVLVEPRKFLGSLENLQVVKESSDLPIIAKGFHFHPLHLAQCTAAGADAFLLMVRVVDTLDSDLRGLIRLGAQLGMDAVVEANSKQEVRKAVKAGAEIIQVNNRNIYSNLSIDLNNVKIGKKTPFNAAYVSASGIEGPDDIKKLYELSNGRMDAVLVGTSVMKADNIQKHIRSLADAGQEVVP